MEEIESQPASAVWKERDACIDILVIFYQFTLRVDVLAVFVVMNAVRANLGQWA